LALAGCDQCLPATGVQQLQQELAGACSLRGASVQRLTNHPAASTQPALAPLAQGQIALWRDDRELPPALYAQRVDPLGQGLNAPRRISHSAFAQRPRVASSGQEVMVVYTHRPPTGEASVQVDVLGLPHLESILAEPHRLAPATFHGAAGLLWNGQAYVIALAQQDSVELFEVVLRSASIPAADGGDAGRPSAGGSLAVSSRRLTLGPDVAQPSSIDLARQGETLFMATDHPEGWSIQIAKVEGDQVVRWAQVVDDRRNQQSHWAAPSLAPCCGDRLALFWEGPGMGLRSLFFLTFDAEGQAVGQERPFEAWVRVEGQERPLGRAPVFDPSLVPAAQGLVAAFADNRYGNTEILLASFACGEGQ
jgi:hypothetical protein